jgi:serralysin
LARVSLDVGGTLISGTLSASGGGTTISVGANGRIVSTEPTTLNAAVFFGGDESLFDNAVEVEAGQTIGVLSNGGNDIFNSGRIAGASGVFLGLSGGTGDVLINSGIVTASRHDNAIRDTRFNNAVFAEGANTRIVNAAGGMLTAISSEGAGVRLGQGGNGSSISIDGTIMATTWFGVDFSGMGVGEAGRR